MKLLSAHHFVPYKQETEQQPKNAYHYTYYKNRGVV